MQARITNPAMTLPDAMNAMLTLNKVIENSGVPATILGLAHMRASQINGCTVCVDMGWRMLKKAGEKDEHIFAGEWINPPPKNSHQEAKAQIKNRLCLLCLFVANPA